MVLWPFSTTFSICLKNPDLKIAVVAPQSRLNGATISAGAMISCFGEITSSTFKTEASKKNSNYVISH